MIVTHNIPATFTDNKLKLTGKNKSLSMEKLSTGYRINRAADDSAGLAISEEMRGQIRGLDRGARNCTDGISMIDTAEGGINELMNVLQRMRELTIQAYNDTYTDDDRIAIQSEVEALSAEMQRITDQTEFNTIKVLQGPAKVITYETVYPAERYREETYYFLSQKEFPKWASHDDAMSQGNPNVHINDENVDTSVYVTYNLNNPDPAFPEISYGPADAGHNYQRPWSDKIQDKYSSRVDFSAIANCRTKDDLFKHLEDLAGTAIGYMCGTCSYAQMIGFSLDDIQFAGVDIPYSESVEVDMQKYYDKIKSLISEEEYNALSPDEQQALGASYADYVGKAASEIAAGIVDDIAEQASVFDGHFMRVVEDDSNPYQIDFYDFRDVNTIPGTSGGDKRLAAIETPTYIKGKVMVENKPMVLQRADEYDYYIQVGANSTQGVFLELPDTSLWALDFLDYNIFREGYCSVTKDGKFDPSALLGATYLGNHKYYNGNFGGYEQSTTKKYSKDVPTTQAYSYTDEHGERKTGVKFTGMTHVEYEYTEVEMVGGQAMTFTAYEPDTLLRVDRAMASLSRSRSYLGAMHNRLEHAYAIDRNTEENLQAAESKIRDTDMADEMVKLSTADILEQAGLSMLAQANSSSDGVLQLLA